MVLKVHSAHPLVNVGRDGLELVAEDARERAAENMAKIMSAKREETKEYMLIEYTLVDKHGREFTAEWSGAPLLDSSGNAVGLIGVSRDITERKRAQEALLCLP